MKVKKIPLRMCVGCMQMLPKKELIRVVKNKTGDLSIDFTGKKPGRGAYVCKNIECFEKAYKTSRLEKNLEIKISEDIYAILREAIYNE
ncbi:MAG TPA: YlxR family protein [Clostridiaceae bacterium]